MRFTERDLVQAAQLRLTDPATLGEWRRWRDAQTWRFKGPLYHCPRCNGTWLVHWSREERLVEVVCGTCLDTSGGRDGWYRIKRTALGVEIF